MAVAARGMAVEVAAVGKGRKQLASAALKQRVGELIAGHNPGSRPADLGSPSGSGTAGGAAAAAAAARAAREAAGTKPIMQRQVVKTATGMQTVQLVKRPPGQGGGGQRPAAAAAAAGSSPGSVIKGQRPSSAAAAQRRQLSPAERAAVAAGRGRPQFKGAFYGGRQPPAALEARMQYNKRRWGAKPGNDVDECCGSWLGTLLAQIVAAMRASLRVGECMAAAAGGVATAATHAHSTLLPPCLQAICSLLSCASLHCSVSNQPALCLSFWLWRLTWPVPMLFTLPCRLSLDSGGSLGSFIASDDELQDFLSDGEEGGQEGDWRAALREATGGCVGGWWVVGWAGSIFGWLFAAQAPLQLHQLWPLQVCMRVRPCCSGCPD